MWSTDKRFPDFHDVLQRFDCPKIVPQQSKIILRINYKTGEDMRRFSFQLPQETATGMWELIRL